MTNSVRKSQYDAVCRERDELARDWDKEHYHRLAIERDRDALADKYNELAAHCERLREAIEEHRTGCDEECVCTEDEILWRVLDETPAQSLERLNGGGDAEEA